MTPLACWLATALAGQVVVAAGMVPPNRPGAVAQPAAAPAAAEASYPRGAVFLLDNYRIEGPLVALADGQLSIDSDPPESVPLDMVERIDLGSSGAPTLSWIGQDNHDKVQTSSQPGTNSIQDIHLLCQGIAPQRNLVQVVITAIIGGQSRIWPLEPHNTPFWRLASDRAGNATTADLYFEPPPADCFEQPFDVTLTFNDKQVTTLRVVAATHTDAELKVVKVEKADEGPTSNPENTLVLLPGEESLRGRPTKIEQEQLTLEPIGGGRVPIPLRWIRGCWLGGDKQPEQRKQFDERLKAPGGKDWVMILARDKTPTAVEGNVEQLVDGKLALAVEGETRKVALERVLAIVLAEHPSPPRDDAFYQVFDLGGGGKISGRIKELNAESVVLRTLWDAEYKLPRADVRSLACRNGRATYLSDFEPAAVEETSYFARLLPYRRDHNLFNEPLRLGGVVYRKGLAVHSRSVITYALDGKFAALQAKLGFDDLAPPGGSVAARVLADGRELYVNPDLSSDAGPVALDLKLEGAKQLVLEIDFGRRTDVGDRILWAGARVFRDSQTAAATAAAAAAQIAAAKSPPAAGQQPPGQPAVQATEGAPANGAGAAIAVDATFEVEAAEEGPVDEDGC